MPPQGAGGVRGAVPRSMRERVGALRNLPPFLKLVWQTSPAISVALVVLRLIRALLPVATLYVGALIIDAVVRVAQHPPAGNSLDAWLASGQLDPVIALLALEFGLAVLADVLGRGVSLLDSLLSERFSIATSLRLMAHAATLDLEDFEDSELQDRLERARTRRRTTSATLIAGLVCQTSFRNGGRLRSAPKRSRIDRGTAPPTPPVPCGGIRPPIEYCRGIRR